MHVRTTVLNSIATPTIFFLKKSKSSRTRSPESRNIHEDKISGPDISCTWSTVQYVARTMVTGVLSGPYALSSLRQAANQN
jgi:hypothetical protein